MALIENLEREGWEQFFSEMFRYALWTLRHNRFGHVGSSVGDLRSWLVAGGIPRIRHNLEYSMAVRRFPEDRAIKITKRIDKLVRDHRSELAALARDGIIPTSGAPDADGLSVRDVQDALRRIALGGRPFEDWMFAHGHTYQDVIEVYKSGDKWLSENGSLPAPGPLPRLQ